MYREATSHGDAWLKNNGNNPYVQGSNRAVNSDLTLLAKNNPYVQGSNHDQKMKDKKRKE